jgi:hypothetical protein
LKREDPAMLERLWLFGLDLLKLAELFSSMKLAMNSWQK